MLHCNHEASTGWTRNSWWGSSAKTRSCLSRRACDEERGDQNETGKDVGRRTESTIRRIGAAKVVRRARIRLTRPSLAATLRAGSTVGGGRPAGEGREMTASEFAFLALGLVLGVASGSAIVVVLGSRPPAREVKLTVGHDAVPRRAATLSSDAFTAHNEPARGGPADRRRLDRDAPSNDPPPPLPFGGAGIPGVPVMGG